MDIKQTLKKLYSPLVWGNFLAMAIVGVGFFIALMIWMSNYTQHGESVEVPEVRDMLLADARYALEDVELVAVISDSTYDKSKPAGTILEQLPPAGSRVKSGREVYLKVNAKFVPTLVIPDIADNSSMREAEARLKALGFKIGPIEYTDGDKYWVYALKCNGREVYAGERVPSDVPIVMVVGNNDSDGDGGWGDETADGEEEIEISLDDLGDE